MLCYIDYQVSALNWQHAVMINPHPAIAANATITILYIFLSLSLLLNPVVFSNSQVAPPFLVFTNYVTFIISPY